jgi:serine phosphatase RsbU (regulator of sigma subunit)
VSGKGIPAALFMGVTMTLLRSMARQCTGPDEILRRVNDELLEQNPRGMFVTLQCLVFDLPKHRVACASAGHHSAVLLAPGKPPRLVIQATGRVVGMLPDNPVTAETLELQPGETLVLFTDGVSEALTRPAALRRGAADTSPGNPDETRRRRRRASRGGVLPRGSEAVRRHHRRPVCLALGVARRASTAGPAPSWHGS